MIAISFTYWQLALGIYIGVAVLIYLFFLLSGGCGYPEGCLGPLFLSVTWPFWAVAFAYERLFHRKK